MTNVYPRLEATRCSESHLMATLLVSILAGNFSYIIYLTDLGWEVHIERGTFKSAAALISKHIMTRYKLRKKLFKKMCSPSPKNTVIVQIAWKWPRTFCVWSLFSQLCIQTVKWGGGGGGAGGSNRMCVRCRMGDLLLLQSPAIYAKGSGRQQCVCACVLSAGVRSRRGHVPLGRGACSRPFLQKKRQGKEILSRAAGRLNSNLLLQQLQTSATFKCTEDKKEFYYKKKFWKILPVASYKFPLV